MSHKNFRRASRSGFTLVELLVATAILAVIMLLVTRMIGDTSKVWGKTTAKIDAFRQARLGFELMTSELAQATTNTYWDYFDANGYTVAQYNLTAGATTFSPAAYGRQSELHFISGPSTILGPGSPPGNLTFGATGGTAAYTHGVFFTWAGGRSLIANYSSLNSLLNATGFFVEFAPDEIPNGGAEVAYNANGPPITVALPPSYRFRLMQYIQPTEYLRVYDYSLISSTAPNTWFANYINTVATHVTNVRIVANNVIALIIWPKKIDNITDTDPSIPTDTALSPTYSYDSRQALTSGVPIPTSVWKPGVNAQPLQMNQMPPILNIAMVALDEPSAKALQGSATTGSTKLFGTSGAFNGLFASAAAPATAPTAMPLGATASYMDNDLATLQTRLAAITPKLNFQIFETTIAIRSAKFSNP